VAAEEKQLCNKVMENGGGRRARMFSFFCFLMGLNPTLESYLANPIIYRVCFGGFWGVLMLSVDREG
jgi:hypothetical protein